MIATTPIDAAFCRAREVHPDLQVGVEAFAAFVADRELAGRELGDLYLACGLAHADPVALATFERVTLRAVDRGLARVQPSEDARGDTLQMLRERMLVARGADGRLGIAAYDGRAPLAIWLRVCAVRIGMRAAERDRRSVAADDERLEQLAPGVPDPELAYLRRHYGDRFRSAFAEAVAQLAPRDRNLLRHAVLDGLGIDQIAAIYHVHRATAARQLGHARHTLVRATRERMRITLGVGETELESILRVLMSMADVTLRGVLGRPQESV